MFHNVDIASHGFALAVALETDKDRAEARVKEACGRNGTYGGRGLATARRLS